MIFIYIRKFVLCALRYENKKKIQYLHVKKNNMRMISMCEKKVSKKDLERNFKS